MVANLRARGVTRIVLITPPPVYEPSRKEAQRLVRQSWQSEEHALLLLLLHCLPVSPARHVL